MGMKVLFYFFSLIAKKNNSKSRFSKERFYLKGLLKGHNNLLQRGGQVLQRGDDADHNISKLLKD